MNAPVITRCDGCGMQAELGDLYDTPDGDLCPVCLDIALAGDDEPDHDARETFERDHAANRGGPV